MESRDQPAPRAYLRDRSSFPIRSEPNSPSTPENQAAVVVVSRRCLRALAETSPPRTHDSIPCVDNLHDSRLSQPCSQPFAPTFKPGFCLATASHIAAPTDPDISGLRENLSPRLCVRVRPRRKRPFLACIASSSMAAISSSSPPLSPQSSITVSASASHLRHASSRSTRPFSLAPHTTSIQPRQRVQCAQRVKYTTRKVLEHNSLSHASARSRQKWYGDRWGVVQQDVYCFLAIPSRRTMGHCRAKAVQPYPRYFPDLGCMEGVSCGPKQKPGESAPLIACIRKSSIWNSKPSYCGLSDPVNDRSSERSGRGAGHSTQHNLQRQP